MMNYIDDTIAAISTPIGAGGIGIVRLSGKDAFSIADKIFDGKKIPSMMPSHTITYGNIIDIDKSIIDEVLLTVMTAPKTYTVEDIVEINCHGGLLMVRRILELLLKSGARLASPGEFTMRAFINGRIDLAQAEAVADIVNASTIESGKAASDQLNGRLSQAVERLREELVDVISYIEAYIDFPDEDFSIDEINLKLKDISDKLQSLLDTYKTGRFFREGLSIAITGKPNVGKSSLLNAFIKRDRAIVTEIPGTTRDTLEEMLNISGIPVRLIDTAGIRPSSDIIESEGIRRSLETIKEADIVIVLFDGSMSMTLEDKEMLNIAGTKALKVINKSDLKRYIEDIPQAISISAKTGAGLSQLKEAIISKASLNKCPPNGIILTNIRHKHAIEQALDCIHRALNLSPAELVALEIRETLGYLAEIIGEVTTDEILNNIFSEFCIGK
jgi:tRNA modification GTPase